MVIPTETVITIHQILKVFFFYRNFFEIRRSENRNCMKNESQTLIDIVPANQISAPPLVKMH